MHAYADDPSPGARQQMAEPAGARSSYDAVLMPLPLAAPVQQIRRTGETRATLPASGTFGSRRGHQRRTGVNHPASTRARSRYLGGLTRLKCFRSVSNPLAGEHPTPPVSRDAGGRTPDHPPAEAIAGTYTASPRYSPFVARLPPCTWRWVGAKYRESQPKRGYRNTFDLGYCRFLPSVPRTTH
jgi:hypothetical protein